MFRKLCGDNALQNVVIVTNMWEQVDPRVGEAREAELAGEYIFFKPVLDKGARMARHDNTVSSAEKIIRLILENHPLPLRIQEEFIDERKEIFQTDAWKELNRELEAQIWKHQQEMRVFRREQVKMLLEIKRKSETTWLRNQQIGLLVVVLGAGSVLLTVFPHLILVCVAGILFFSFRLFVSYIRRFFEALASAVSEAPRRVAGWLIGRTRN